MRFRHLIIIIIPLAASPPTSNPFPSSGYEEIMTDPSYKGQFVVFTCPHIGNVGINYGEARRPCMHAAAADMQGSDFIRTSLGRNQELRWQCVCGGGRGHLYIR